MFASIRPAGLEVLKGIAIRLAIGGSPSITVSDSEISESRKLADTPSSLTTSARTGTDPQGALVEYHVSTVGRDGGKSSTKEYVTRRYAFKPMVRCGVPTEGCMYVFLPTAQRGGTARWPSGKAMEVDNV